MSRLGLVGRISLWLCAVGVASLGATGCGGFEIKTTFDEDLLGQVPMTDLQPIVDQETDLSKTKLLVGQAVYAQTDAENEAQKASTASDQADLQVQNAQSDMDFAQNTADQTKIANAQRELDLANAAKSAADAKSEYYTAKAQYEGDSVTATRAQVLYDEALIELTKAKIADSHKIRPDGFNLQDFQTQADDGKTYYNDQAQSAKDDYNKLSELEKTYNTTEANYEKAQGKVTANGLQTDPLLSQGTAATTPPPGGASNNSSGSGDSSDASSDGSSSGGSKHKHGH
jgi:hypothetical protein